jgi:hypothetical protein
MNEVSHSCRIYLLGAKITDLKDVRGRCVRLRKSSIFSLV